MERKFSRIKNDILGKDYSLSIAYISQNKSKELNKKFRKKDKPTNILSFALHKNVGEILLCLPVIRKEAKNFERTFEQFLGFLVIHGMLHLKGMKHSSTMERTEKKYDTKYFGGNRRGLSHDTNSGGRISRRRKKS